MRRLARWTFNALTALSLLLSLVVVRLQTGAKSPHAALAIPVFGGAVVGQRNPSPPISDGTLMIWWFPRGSFDGYGWLDSNSTFIQTGFYVPDNARTIAEWRAFLLLRIQFDAVADAEGRFVTHPVDDGTPFVDRWTEHWSYCLRTPFWAAYTFLLSLPALRAVAYARRVRRRVCAAKPSTCARCGYDLNGNVSGICPECGRSWRVGAE